MAGPWYIKSTVATDWTALTTYAVGARVVAISGSATVQFRVYEATAITTGISGAAQPSFNTTLGGTTTDSGVTWTARNPTTAANAHRYLNRLLMANIDVIAGDTLYVSNVHSEATTGNGPTFPITLGSRDTPTHVLCVTDASFGSTNVLSTGAVVAYSGTQSFGSYIYYHGIEFKSGNGVATTQNMNVGGSAIVSRLVFRSCILNLASTGGASVLHLGETSTGLIFSVDFFNTSVAIGAAGATISLNTGQITILGGSITGTAPTTLFIQGASGVALNRILMVDGCDLSLVSGNIYSMSDRTGDGSTIIFRHCKRHASSTMWANTPSSASGIFRAIRCSSDTANYHYSEKGYYGTIDDDNATYLNGGASDGTTVASRKMVSTANSKQAQPLYSPWMQYWNDVTGAVTLTVQVFRDSVTNLKDNEVWLEVMYPSSAATPISSLISDASAILGAGADQDASAETWTNSASNPNAQQLVVTPTIGMKGVILARVCLAKASTTLWYNHRVVQT